MRTAERLEARAWRADTLDASPQWYYRLTDECGACLERALADLRQRPRDATSIAADEYPAPADGFVPTALSALEQGRGFAVIDGLPMDCLSKPETIALYWIVEVGHPKAGQPLTPAQVEALDVLDAVLRRRELAAEFMLRPGQMFFINNRWILHNRTAFEDYPEFERRRHYVRLWLKARPA